MLFFLISKPTAYKSVCPSVCRGHGCGLWRPPNSGQLRGLQGQGALEQGPETQGGPGLGWGQSFQLQVARPLRKLSSEPAAPA